jgi:hypothetical protein
VDDLERTVVGSTGLVDAIEPAEQLRSRRVQVVVALEVEALHQFERGLDLAGFGHRGRPVQLDDR